MFLKNWVALVICILSFFGHKAFCSAFTSNVDNESEETLQKYQSILQHYTEELNHDPKNKTLILAVASAYNSIKDYQHAIEYYNKALELEPDSFDIQKSLALAYLANNQLDLSQKLLEQLIAKEPNNPTLLGALGRIESHRHHLDLAEKYYQQALAIDPSNFTARYYLAELMIEKKQYDLAQKSLEELLNENPKAGWVQQALLRAKLEPIINDIHGLILQEKFNDAILKYKEQLALYPNNIDLLTGLGNVYILMKAYPKAISLLESGIKIHPHSEALKITLGFAYLENKQYPEAKYIFKMALKNGTMTSDALAGLGRIAELHHHENEAEKYYNKSLQINPANSFSLSYLAQMRVQQKRYNEAQKLFEQILMMEPNALWVKQAIENAKSAYFLDLIKTEEEKKNFQKVERLYLKLLAKEPRNVENYIRFAKFYLARNNREAALAILEQGLLVDPESTQLKLSQAFAYLETLELSKSQHIFETILKTDPLNAYAITGLGRIQANIGDTAAAEFLYLKALSIDPNNITALSYLADSQMEQKHYAIAQYLYKKLIKLEPNAEWARQAFLKAQDAPQLEEINKLIKIGSTEEAILSLQQLILASPENIDIYLELGNLYIEAKRFHDAAAIYQLGLKHLPQSNDLLVALGINYLNMQEFSNAKRALQTAFNSNPGNPETLAALGRLSALTGDREDAEYFYEMALKRDPNNILALSYLAEFYTDQKQFIKAQHLYEEILKISPASTWAKVLLEQAKYGPVLQEIYEQEGKRDYRGVEQLYKELIAKSPNNIDYYIKLGQFYVRMKRFQEAIIIYQQGLHLEPRSVDLQLALGFAYLKKEEFAIAKNTFELILRDHPDNAEAIAGLGRLAEQQGDEATAKTFYEKAIKENPKNITALIFLAELLKKNGEYDEAQKVFQRLLKINPSDAWVKIAIQESKYGRLLAEIKRKEEEKDFIGTEMLFQQLLVEAPNEAEFYLKAGLFYHRTKQYQKAIDTYLKGIKIDPKSPDLYAALGLVYLSKKNPKDARKAFNKALKLDPQNSDSLAGLGSAAILDKNYEKAEKYNLAALTVDPNNIAALSSMANLKMIQKNYPEAMSLYARLLELRPKEKWIKLLYDNSKYGNELDEIKQLIDNEELSAAAEKYKFLLSQVPDNYYYAWGLGQMYLRLKQYSKAIDVFSKALEDNPEENELLVSLGYAYLFNNNLSQAREVLTKALKRDDKNAEILAGIGRVNALEDNTCLAEEQYIQALTISPINLSALTFYGDLLMKQKRYPEAQNIFSNLQHLLPRAEWVRRILQDAQDGPLMDLAQEYADREQFERAADIYQQLLCSLPEDPARYLPLGQMYANIQQYCRAISIFEAGLEIDPDALYLWRAIAFTYILMADYNTAGCIFMYVLGEDPKDAEAWAGLGRIEALHGSYCLAEDYYYYALELAPGNITALSFLGALRKDEQYFFSALEIYSEILDINPRPKWVRVEYNNLLNLTFATISVEGALHQEVQWDPTVHKWSAQYEVSGGRALLNYPISDILSVWGRVADEFYSLKDFLTHKTLYSFDVQRVHLGAKRVMSRCYFLEARLGLSSYSPYRRGTFREQNGVIIEPSLSFIFHQPRQKASLSFSSDSDLVARDFNDRKAKIVGRYFIAATYEREVFKRGWIGIEGDAYWYDDYVNNSFQRAFGWVQWRPPFYSDNIIFRYQTKYQRFDKNIPDYYTYKDQTVNQLQMTLEKYWRVCWADSFYTSLSYGHGWQDTFSRFGQIIVIAPAVGALKPFWDRRQFDVLYGNVIYNCDQLQLNLNADYYHDTEKYTMWSVIGGLRWRF